MPEFFCFFLKKKKKEEDTNIFVFMEIHGDWDKIKSKTKRTEPQNMGEQLFGINCDPVC